MNKQIKQQWINALRSGEYNQCKLRSKKDDNSYCALGVLCDLYAKEHNIQWEVKQDEDYKIYALFGQQTVLPHEVINWAGMYSRLGAYTEKNTREVRFLLFFKRKVKEETRTTIIVQNDCCGKSFNEIADII